jgi:hypothetical protein
LESEFGIDYKLSMQESEKDKKGGTAAEDQRDREYYYDDAHGYEAFDPTVDDGEEDEGETGRKGDGDTEVSTEGAE